MQSVDMDVDPGPNGPLVNRFRAGIFLLSSGFVGFFGLLGGDCLLRWVLGTTDRKKVKIINKNREKDLRLLSLGPHPTRI